MWQMPSFHLVDVAVYCSGIEFSQKIIKINVLAVVGYSAAEGTGKVGGCLEIVTDLLDI